MKEEMNIFWNEIVFKFKNERIIHLKIIKKYIFISFTELN